MQSDHTEPYPEQRQGEERRQPTSIWSILRLGGQRKVARREGEGEETYVDRPARRVTLLVSIILSSSILDACLTLRYIELGGGEANPVMAVAIHSGDAWFLTLKMALTVIGVILLAIHQNFRLGLRGLYAMASVYLALLVYHGVLLLH